VSYPPYRRKLNAADFTTDEEETFPEGLNGNHVALDAWVTELTTFLQLSVQERRPQSTPGADSNSQVKYHAVAGI
jgi:hypothetical protein